MTKFLAMSLAFALIIPGLGCGPSTFLDSFSSDEFLQEGPARQDLALAATDLEALKYFSARSMGPSLRGTNRFEQVFGGTSGTHVRQFVDERIKYFLSIDDLWTGTQSSSGASQEKGQKPGWTRTDNAEQMQAYVGAANYGVQVWLQSLINQAPATVILKSGRTIPVRSSRVGIMLIGPAYNAGMRNQMGSVVPFPQEYRQSILIHEARHSDCVGGVTQEDLVIARGATSYSEFMERFKSKRCGHLHSLCTEGDFQGLPACDSMLWGSYGIQALYLEAALKQTPVGTEKYQLLLSTFMDTKSRLIFDYDQDMIEGLEDPELNSLGLL